MQQQQDEDDTEVGGGGPRLRHPRSDWLLSRLPDPERHFRIMAKVGGRWLVGGCWAVDWAVGWAAWEVGVEL